MCYVSIITPVYNGAKYINKAIESVLKQTFTDFELIIINDGSIDNSKQICEYYASLDSRIKLINVENGGVSKARNIGLKNSSGEWITFLDADDYVEENFLKKFIQEISEDVDLVISGYKKVEESSLIDYMIPSYYKGYRKELFNNLFELKANELCNIVWNKLYRANLIKKNRISFDENLSMAEDLIFNLIYFENINNYVLIEDMEYRYVIYSNNESLTKRYDEKFLKAIKKQFEETRLFLLRNDVYSENNELEINSEYLNGIAWTISLLISSNEKSKFQKIKKILNQTSEIQNMVFKKTENILYSIRNYFIINNKPLIVYIIFFLYHLKNKRQ